MSSTTPLPLALFFANYSAFTYDPTAPVSDEWRRLCRTYWNQWRRGTADKDLAYSGYKDALAQQFDVLYGTKPRSLRPWGLLCTRMGISPVPKTRQEAFDAVMLKHVNLIDLIDAHMANSVAPTFDSAEELDVYNKQTYKFFPVTNTHVGGLGRVLLRRGSSVRGATVVDVQQPSSIIGSKGASAPAQKSQSVYMNRLAGGTAPTPNANSNEKSKTRGNTSENANMASRSGKRVGAWATAQRASKSRAVNIKKSKFVLRPDAPSRRWNVRDAPLDKLRMQELEGGDLVLGGEMKKATYVPPVADTIGRRDGGRWGRPEITRAMRLEQRCLAPWDGPDNRTDRRKGDWRAMIDEGRGASFWA